MIREEAERELKSYIYRCREVEEVRKELQSCKDVMNGYIKGNKQECAERMKSVVLVYDDIFTSAKGISAEILSRILALRFPYREVLFRYYVRRQHVHKIAYEMGYSIRAIGSIKAKGINQYAQNFREPM